MSTNKKFRFGFFVLGFLGPTALLFVSEKRSPGSIASAICGWIGGWSLIAIVIVIVGHYENVLSQRRLLADQQIAREAQLATQRLNEMQAQERQRSRQLEIAENRRLEAYSSYLLMLNDIRKDKAQINSVLENATWMSKYVDRTPEKMDRPKAIAKESSLEIIESAKKKLEEEHVRLSMRLKRLQTMKEEYDAKKAAEYAAKPKIVCEKCSGIGLIEVARVPCNKCNATGKIETAFACHHCGGTGRASYDVTCKSCGGTGSHKTKCDFCNGKGMVPCSACNGVGSYKQESYEERLKGTVSRVKRRVRCSQCNGKGREVCYNCHNGYGPSYLCKKCSGRGKIIVDGKCRYCKDGTIKQFEPCSYCDNGITVQTNTCDKCDGNGWYK